MYQHISFCDFTDAFHAANRRDQFSYDGLVALYDYLEMLEDDCGIPIQLDVIALCCEYTEYDSLQDLQDNYSDIRSLDHLREYTQVIECANGHIIIQDF